MASPDAYTRLVNTSKLVLPLVALGILSTLFLFSGRIDPDAAIPYAEIDVEAAAREQRLTAARFATVGSDGADIEFEAAIARPDPVDPEHITADDIEGHIEMQDGSALNLSAGGASVDLTARIAGLTQDVLVETSTGYRISAPALTVRMDRAEITSDGAVSVLTPYGTLDAGNMVLSRMDGPDSPYRLLFNNRVRLVYAPK